MSGGLMILLIIVVWLCVLAPLLLKGQRPISKAGEAFEETRVVYSGQEGDLPARPQPRVRAEDIRRRDTDDSEDHADYEVVSAVADEDLLIDEPSAPAAAEDAESPETDAVIDGEVVDTAAVAEQSGEDGTTATLELETSGEALPELEAEDIYESSDAHVGPADLLHRGPANLSVVEPEDTPEAAPEEVAEEEHTDEEEFAEPTEEDLVYAQRRAGRGGWDPERDRTYATTRYQRRQRTLAGLAVAIVISAVLGVVVGGWMWLAPAIVAAVTVLYLVALRRQVQQERALRQQRLRHVRRARLGVRSKSAEDLNIPQQLRRHGAVVVELDDESPDFDYLPTTTATFDEDTPDPSNGPADGGGRGRLRVS